MTVQLTQTFWVNHQLDILLLSICMYNIPTPSLTNYSLTKPQDGWADNVHICLPMWKCHKLPLLHITSNVHLAITKLLSFMSPKHSDCNSNCSKVTQTCKIPPSYMHGRANFIQGEEICKGRMTDKIRNLYQIIMVKMFTINDVIMTGNLFPVLTQCNIYKPQWLRNCHFTWNRMAAVLWKQWWVNPSTSFYPPCCAHTHTYKMKNECIQIHTNTVQK